MNRELIEKVLSGEADAAGIRRLTELMREDESVRREYAAAVELEALLSVALEDKLTRAENVLRIRETVAGSDSEAFVLGLKARLRRRRYAWFGAVAAAFLVGLFSWWYSLVTVGRISDMYGVVHGPSGEFETGDTIRKGRILEFGEGLIEVDIGERGRLVVDGPARIEFLDKSRAFLHQGHLVAHLSPEGEGYRIGTPDGELTGLGSMMGVVMRDEWGAEAHALQGQVAVSYGSGEKWILESSQVFRLRDRSRRSADVGQFRVSLPHGSTAGRGGIYWSFDEGTGIMARGVGSGALSGKKADFGLRKEKGGEIPDWTEGVSGRALYFDGKGAFGESAYRGIEGGAPRTVCFWVKVPEDSGIKEGFAMVAWGSQVLDKAWQISVQPIENQGPLGRLRVGVYHGASVGRTDLRDGKWHHIAVVLKDEVLPDVSMEVIMYVDGVPEQFTYRMTGEVKTDSGPDGHGIWIGRNLAKGSSQGNFFRGAIDELHIFNHVLSQSEILAIRDSAVPVR